MTSTIAASRRRPLPPWAVVAGAATLIAVVLFVSQRTSGADAGAACPAIKRQADDLAKTVSERQRSLDALVSAGATSAQTERQAFFDAVSTLAYTVIDNSQCFDASTVAHAHTQLDNVKKYR